MRRERRRKSRRSKWDCVHTRDAARLAGRGYGRICMDVARVALEMGAAAAGRSIGMLHCGCGITWELLASDYRLEVMLTVRRLARERPDLAKMRTAAERHAFRVRCGQAFVSAGLWPVGVYFADSRPQELLVATPG